MRALIVHAGNLSGGVEQVLASIARVTRARGEVDLEFALVFDGEIANALRTTGAAVHVIGPARARDPLSLWKARRRLARVMLARRPAVVVTASAWSLALFGGAAAVRGLPLVHWVHDALGGRHWIERLAARRRPDLLLCSSGYSAACAARVFPGVPHAVLHAPRRAPASGPAEPRAAVRARFDTRDDAIVIAQVGRTDPLKGHRVLIDALARLSSDPRWVCWQIGAPQNVREQAYWRDLQRSVVDRGLDSRLRFVGHQPDVPSVLRAADIYCQPNVGPEAFGLTLVEALDAGLPIVTSRVGAAIEVLEGTYHVLAAPGDAAAVAAALEALIDDPAARRRLGAPGPARARALGDPDAAHGVFAEALGRVAGALPGA